MHAQLYVKLAAQDHVRVATGNAHTGHASRSYRFNQGRGDQIPSARDSVNFCDPSNHGYGGFVLRLQVPLWGVFPIHSE